MRSARVGGFLFPAALVMVAAFALTAQPAQAQSLFGANSLVTCPGPSNLYSINPATGAATVIGPIVGPGPTNFCLVTAMAFDPTTRILYSIACPGVTCSSAVLLTINPATGAATEVGPVGTFATDMSFRSDGTLYAYAPDVVYTVDKSTGTPTLVGPSGVGGGGNGIAFSPTDVLFHAGGGDLNTLSQTTGAGTFVAGLTFPAGCGGFQRVNAMDFQPGSGTLFGSLNCGNSSWRIGKINTSTGVITDVGPTVNQLDALAFQPGLSGLSPAKLWVGLKNSDDVGLRLDLKAEVFINSTANPVAAYGELDNVASGSSGFNNALLNTIGLALTGGPVSLSPGDTLLFRVSVRRTCFGKGHTSGTARLWYNGKAIDTGNTRDAGSRFDATIDGSTSDYYLRNGFILSTTAGASRTSIDKFVDSSAACPARPFLPFGQTWSVAP